MRNVAAVFRRELASYFATPVAYVFIIIFLLLSGIFTFYLGGFYERGQADLAPFFNFHPWLYLFLIPAISMRMWAEERKSGTHRVADDAADHAGAGGVGQIPRRVVLCRHRTSADVPDLAHRELSRQPR